MRGEYGRQWSVRKIRLELPPRARRIHKSDQIISTPKGTTSACAENTDGFGGKRGGAKNYLRVRGEYCGETIAPQVTQELPPRARRIPVKTCHPKPRRGTTSACAENTDVCHGGFGLVWNYLRVRGEYQDRNRSFLRWGELPPRARRIPFFHFNCATAIGTTSACAENTDPAPYAAY